MQIQKKFRRGGYSTDTAKIYIDSKKPIISLSTELEQQQNFEDNKPTGEIIAYKAWFTQEGLPPFEVKFSSEIELPKYMAVISFENLQACEVNYRVYFKADALQEIK